MDNVLLTVAVLACPIGMGLMMWFMARGMKHGESDGRGEATPSAEELRQEQRRLESEIDRLEHERGAREPLAR